ncbi:hypothetical protein DH2020_027807 [Rehmannia glutinosa]|uniref:Amino acid transporter transmembrane domain-containing protein n=1 Tax=Rehmannia glutinosa TaxID=99300 RepID=A0ABR0VWX5_REHGL
MGGVRPSSTELHDRKDGKAPPPTAAGDKGLDAGSWIHSGYHLTTSIVAPPLLSLPFAFASLGWTAGVVCLVIGAVVTFYSYNLLSLVLEHHAQLGHRHLRFRDMANDILALPALQGHTLSVYLACATAGSIYIGSTSKGPRKDHSLDSNNETRIFGIFNALAIIATTFGNGIIPEIQVCVAISGYWAFGNQADGSILSNLLDDYGKSLVPKWFVLMTNAFTILQLSAVAVVYLQPTNEVLERTFADPRSGEFSARNVIPRVISRSLSVVIATTIAAMLPFFGDINAMIGAFGFMPLDFVLPVIFFNLTFKPSKRGLIFWLNTTIAVVFSVLAVIAAVAAVRQISLDAKTYRLFANV